MDRIVKSLCLLLLGITLAGLFGCASTAEDSWLPDTPTPTHTDDHGWGQPTSQNAH